MQGQSYIRTRGVAGIGYNLGARNRQGVSAKRGVRRAGESSRCGFLTEKFVETDRHRLPCDVTEESFDYLVSSAERFAKSRGKELRIERGADKVDIIASMYDQINELMDERQGLELFLDDENGGDLYFVINKWMMDDMTCYFLPFKFTYQMKDKELGLLTRRFLSAFRRVNGWSSVYDSYLFESLNEEMYYEESLDDSDIDEQYASYFGEGEIARRIKEFKDLAPLVPEELLSYVPSSEDAPLYDMLVDGLKFIDEKQNFRMFSYLWSECYFRNWPTDDWGDETMMIQPIDELFSIVYDEGDAMTERLIAYLSSNVQCGDTEQDMLVEQISLKPDRDVEFTSRVPEIIKFISDFANMAERYEKLD